MEGDGAAGGVSSYSSGGGGVVLEQLYAATLLSSLLVGGSAVELGDGSEIKRVRFQAGEESPVDDLVVTGSVRGQERRVAIGVRRKITLTRSHDKTKKLLAAYVQMTAEQQEEIEAGLLGLCLAVAVETQHVQELRLLVKLAGTTSDEAAFRAKVNEGGPGSALSKRLVHVDAMVAEAARSAGPVGVGVNAGLLTWRLLRCLQVRSLRLEDERTDRTHAIEILQPLTEKKTPAAGEDLFARIDELAGRYARDGADVTQARLRADLGMPAVGGTAQGKRVLRVVVGVDIERYSRRNSRQQSDLQHVLNDLLNEAARAAGLDRQDWAKYPAGDGEIAILPADTDMVTVVSGFFGQLGSRLAAYNKDHPKDGFRLRTAVHMGMVNLGTPMGAAGQPTVVLSRLLDSEQLRQRLKDDVGASAVFLVSTVVHHEVAGSGYSGVELERFRRVTVDNPGKGFRQDAYLYFAGDGAEVPDGWGTEDSGETEPVRRGWSLGHDPEEARHWDPRSRGVSIGSEKGWRFRGRTAALRKIVDWLDREVPERGVLVVTGSPGAGKSAVLGRIVTTADAAARGTIPPDDTGVKACVGSVHCAVHAKSKTALEVAGEIARAALAAVPERIEDFAPALEAALRGPGRDGSRDRFNVVIDALDEASSPGQAREIARKVILPLAETFADDGARVVAGTRRTDGGGDLLRAFEDAGHVVDLDTPEYFEEEDLAGYALACLQVDSSERPGNPSPYTDAEAEAARPLAEAIARAADGNFLIGGLVARTRGVYDKQAADPARLRPVRSVRDALEEYLERLPGIEHISAWRLLTALAFAEDSGLTADLWKLAVEALPPGGSDEDWPVQVQARRLDAFARSGAANFLVETNGRSGPAGPGRKSYRLFHQALSEALLAARAEFTDRVDDERELTEAFLQVGRDSGWERAPVYLLRFLSAHSARAKMIDELLGDDSFLVHSDLRRLVPFADDSTSVKGRARARLLRFTPQALDAVPADRAALLSVTEALDDLGSSYSSDKWRAPYRALWANTPPRLAHTYLKGHVGRIAAVCEVSVDGVTLVATAGTDSILDAGADHAVRIWNPLTGEQVKILKGHQGTVNTLCMVTCCDDAQLASGSDDGTVRLWNLRARQASDVEVRTLRTGGFQRGRRHETWVKSLCEVGIGKQKLLAASDVDGVVQIWNPRNGDPANRIEASELPVWSMCEVPVRRGFLLATGSGDQSVGLWDPRTAELVHSMKIDFLAGRAGMERSVNALCMTRFDNRAVLAIGGPNVKLFDPETGNQVHILSSSRRRKIDFLCEINLEGNRMLVGSGWEGTNAPQASDAQLWDLTGRNRLDPCEVQRDVELIGSIRTEIRTFLACRSFNAVALQDAREVFKQTLQAEN